RAERTRTRARCGARGRVARKDVARMNVVVVDWLGRGGIAQTTGTWAMELRRSGPHVGGGSRPERGARTPSPGPGFPADRWHRPYTVLRAAAEEIRRQRPDIVVIQNYVIPALEASVQRAAAAAGSRLIVVLHNDSPHSLTSGTTVGLRSWLRRAD